jgi:rhodanese-related sulfurtransferase
MKRAVIEALVIVLAGSLLAFGINTLRPGGIELLPPERSVPAVAPPEEFEPQEIGIDAALEKAADNQALFVDARAPEEFRRGHIREARNLPALRADAWLPDFFAAVDPARPLIAYCHGLDCDLAKELAQILTDAGYENVYYLVDGWGVWQQRGLPVEREGE